MRPSVLRDRPFFGSAQSGDEERSPGQIIDGRPEQSLKSRTRGADQGRTNALSGISPHVVLCPRQRRLLLCRDAGRLGPSLPRQQSLSLFSPARGSSFYSSARPHSALVAYVLAAGSAHFLATQQAHWPPLYALTCELFDAVKVVAAAAGIRILIRSPLKALTLRDAIIFILIAVVLVPFGTAFWGAAFTVSNGFGTDYWIEWRNLGISNAVTTVVMVPALLLGAYHLAVGRPTLQPRRALEAALVIASA
jgi:hypothetical protein